MDFSFYSNIDAVLKSLGGEKRNPFNKKLLVEAEESWKQLSAEEMTQLNWQMPNAIKCFSTIVTPTAFCVYDVRTFKAIPVRDILWIYGNQTTNRMNFIPTSKTFALWCVTRNGQFHTLGSVEKGPFGNKTLLSDTMKAIQDYILPYRKGIIFGWSEEINRLFTQNLQQGIELVDSNSQQ